MKEFALFINVTKECNINCDKCYLTEESRSTSFFLSEKTFQRFIDSPALRNADSVTVIFQGGEVLLAGEDRLVGYCKQVNNILPNAKLTMVSNLIALPDWIISVCRQYFNSKFETTFALKGKRLIGSKVNSEERYVEKFKRSLKKAIDSGLDCTVNVEANSETVAAGAKEIIEIATSTGCYSWEFDFSVDFKSYLNGKELNLFGYPILPLQETYLNYSNYFSDLIHLIEKLDLKEKFQSGLISFLLGNTENQGFNVSKDLNFLTLNPDGTVTTNPLFSDIERTYLGNINSSDLESILNSIRRRFRSRHELERKKTCVSCKYFDTCRSGPSHIPILDGSGECCGFYGLRESIGGFVSANHPLSKAPGF